MDELAEYAVEAQPTDGCSKIVDNLKEAEAVLIVDVSNLVYRCAYAHEELATSDGRRSGHVFGAFQVLRSVFINDLPPKKWFIVFCYDLPTSKAFRQDILPTYKANRKQKDFNPLPEASAALANIPGLHLSHPNREADDCIYWISTWITRNGYADKDIVIYSGDKDMWTFTDLPGVKVLSPNLGRMVTKEDIVKHFYVDSPSKIPLSKSLFGDPSDGIKGPNRLLKKHVVSYLEPENVTLESFLEAVKSSSTMPLNTKTKILEASDLIRANYKVACPDIYSFEGPGNLRKHSVRTSTGDGAEGLENVFAEYECTSLVGTSGFFFGDAIATSASLEKMFGLEK